MTVAHDHHHEGHDHDGHLHEIEALIAHVPLFAGLGDDELTEIARRVRPREYRANEHLYGAGDSSPNLFVIHTGRVKVYRLSESGHEQVIRVLGSGEFLGEASFLTGEPLDHFAVTVAPGEICSLHASELRDHLLTSPTVAVRMLTALSRRLGTTEEQLRAVTGDSAGRRVADYLLDLADAGRERAPARGAPAGGTPASRPSASGPLVVQLPVAKKDIASQLGITPETLSRKLTQFEDAGLVRQHGRRIALLDIEGLRDTDR